MLPVLTEFEKSHISERQRLPERYLGLPDEELDRRITAAKAALGTRLIILGHHYQRDEVIKFADYIGDSFRLAGQVAQHPGSGIHRFLRRALHGGKRRRACRAASAGYPARSRCRLLDGRHGRDRSARNVLGRAFASHRIDDRRWQPVVPITYINSSAAIKAFVGERGGIVCTSTNCAATLRWAWERGERILFLPDQHLGRNTAYKMGVPLEKMVVWDPNEMCGGRTVDAAARRDDDSVEGALFGPRAIHRGADRARSRTASRRPRHRPSRSAVGRRAGRGRQRLDRVHHPPGHRERSRIDLGGRHRDPSGQPACEQRRRRRRRCCRSISSDACARRCSACRPTICCGCSRGCWKARCTTG